MLEPDASYGDSPEDEDDESPEDELCDEDAELWDEDFLCALLFAATFACAWLFRVSAGSCPVTIWKKITAHATAKVVNDVATTRRRMRRNRQRRSARSRRPSGLMPR